MTALANATNSPIRLSRRSISSLALMKCGISGGVTASTRLSSLRLNKV